MSEWICPRDLELSQRFDIFAKYFFAQSFLTATSTNFHYRAYEDHIRVFNSFLETDEHGTPQKVGASAFVDAFKTLSTSIKTQGFDSSHPVPIGHDATPQNGAHRVSICMALDQKVCIARRPELHLTRPWDYAFFRERGMRPEYMDAIGAAMLRWYDDVRACVIFGAASHASDEIVEELKRTSTVLYTKTIPLSKVGQDNLIRLVYAGERWLGRLEFGYLGAGGKARPCFPSDRASEVTLVFIRAPKSHEELVSEKERIRAKLKMGKHSLHITDTKQEATNISDSLLNSNGVHLVNNKRYGRLINFERDMQALKETVARAAIAPENLAVVGSAILSAYGVRDARDLDIVVSTAEKGDLKDAGLADSNAHWRGLGFEVDELINNPAHHFWYEGVKFVCLEDLIALKKRRGEGKDKIDLELVRIMVQRVSPLKASLSRLELLIRLYSNAQWIRSYAGHWLARLNIRTRSGARTIWFGRRK